MSRQDLLLLVIRVLVTAVCALCLSLLAAPSNWFWLSWIVYIPMFWVVRENTPRTNALLGLLYGFLGVGALFRWIAETIILFSNLPTSLALLALALFALVFGSPHALLWWAVHPLRRRLGIWVVVAFPALWVVLEWVQFVVFLFPYNHGVSQYQFPFTWQLASITGVWGLSFLILAFNTAFGEGIYRLQEGRPWPILLTCAAVSALSLDILFGFFRYRAVEATLEAGPSLRLGQIQSDVTMTERLNDPSACVGFYWWVDQTKLIPPGSVDLVVWPEGSAPYPLDEVAARDFPRVRGADCRRPKDPGNVVSEVAKQGKFGIVVGSGARDPKPGSGSKAPPQYFNSSFFVDRDGKIHERYDKLVPLPFGEYLPFPFSLFKGYITGPGNFGHGTVPVQFDTGEILLATPICYEAILPGVCARFPDPDLFVNITNDAWFGDTAAPWQHAMLAAARSTEFGVPMVRSAYSGISMVVEPHGRIHSVGKPFTAEARIVRVRLAKVWTFYGFMARYGLGEWFVYTCAAFLAGALLASPWLQKQRR